MGAIGKYKNGAYVEFASTGGGNIGDIEPNKAIVSNENGVIISSSVTDAEIEALSGVKSNLQAQIDALEGKPAPTPTEYGGAVTTILNDDLTADKVLVSDENGKVSASTVTKTQLGYLDGLTGNVQEQINYLMENVGSGGTPLSAVTALEASGKRGSAEIKWTDPEDVVFNGETLAQFDGTKVVRNTEHYPTSTDDGVVAVDSKVRNQYAETPFVDGNLENDRDYYYTLFPYTAKNIYTFSDKNKAIARPLDFDPVLANNTWEMISLASVSGVAKDIWSYGDRKDDCVIIGFDHDVLEVGEGEEQRKAGITFYCDMTYNDTYTYPLVYSNVTASSYKNYINTNLYTRAEEAGNTGLVNQTKRYIPEGALPYLKTVLKKYYTSNGQGRLGEVACKAFALSAPEIIPPEEVVTTIYGYEDGTFYEGFRTVNLNVESRGIWTRLTSASMISSRWYGWYFLIGNDTYKPKGMHSSLRTESKAYKFCFCI